MAETPVIKAERREEFGKGAARRLRRDFRLPGVSYGPNLDEPIHFHVDLLEMQTLIRYNGVNAVMELEIDGEQHLSMVKVIDQNILTLDIDHIDLLSITRGEKVEVEVPVVTTGEVFSGATLIQEADTLLLLADVLNIPEEIVIDVDDVEAGNQINAGDVTLPEGIALADDPELLVLNITHEEESDVPDDDEAAEGEASAEGSNDSE